MKCKHTHTISGKDVQCDLNTHIELPLDEKSLCIFHSNDILWKKENDLKSYLTELFKYIYDNKINFGFYNFIFTGEDIVVDFPIDNILLFNRLISKTTLTFYDCIFLCEIELIECKFKEALNFVNCKFNNYFTLNNCTFYNELNIYNNSHFTKRLGFYCDNTFNNNVRINNSTFEEELSIENNSFNGNLEIDDCSFSINHGLHLYLNKFLKGFYIRNSFKIGNLTIIENNIRDNAIISNINNDRFMDISKNKYHKDFTFQGIEGNLLFNPDTIFEIQKKDLTNSTSRIIFDYCDINNLKVKTLRTLTELEEIDQVVFNDTNKMTRSRIVHYIENRNIPEYLLSDIFTLVGRYFENHYSLQLSVSVQKMLSVNKTKVTFSSKQLIDLDVFNEIFINCVKNIFSDNEFNEDATTYDKYDDLRVQVKNLNTRINNHYQNKIFNSEDLIKVLMLEKNNLIYINNLNELNMGDKIKINKSQTGAVGSNAIAKNNTFNNLNKENDIDYKKLLSELKILKKNLVSKAKKKKEKQAIIEIQSAIVAVENKKYSKVITHLLNAGKWTLNTAKEIGVEVVANLITNNM